MSENGAADVGSRSGVGEDRGRQQPAGWWRAGLPEIATGRLTVREARLADAPALLAMLGTDEVTRFISPPPSTVEGFERFIYWTHRQREAGLHVCFVVVPAGEDGPRGLVQIRKLEADWSAAEWGFALGSPYWGTGLFREAAAVILEFVFSRMGVHRLEARATTANERGNGALARVGAVREGLLRQSFFRHGRYEDQVLWTLTRDDWMVRKAASPQTIH
jgi:ribosomal-protein-alanine N-acetyltransferase